MDVSALTAALNALTAAVVTGLGVLGDDVAALLRAAMGLSYTLALILWLWEGRLAVHGPFLRMVLKFAAIGWLVEWFPVGADRLVRAAADTGLALVPAEGFSLADPGRIAFLGLQAITPLMIRVKQMLGPIDFFLNFLEIVLFLSAALVTLVAFCVLAIQVFLAFLEWRLLSLAAYLAIPFAVLGPTSFVAERAIGYVAATALRLLVLGLVVALSGATLATLRFTGDPTLAQAFGVAVLSAAMFVLAMRAPRAAAGLVNGGPVLDGVSALAGLYTAARLGAAAALGTAGMAAGTARSARLGAAQVLGRLSGGGAATAGRTATKATGLAADPWSRPMTAGQRAELDRLAEGRTYRTDLTRGEASKLIEAWGGSRSAMEDGTSVGTTPVSPVAPPASSEAPAAREQETGS